MMSKRMPKGPKLDGCIQVSGGSAGASTADPSARSRAWCKSLEIGTTGPDGDIKRCQWRGKGHGRDGLDLLVADISLSCGERGRGREPAHATDRGLDEKKEEKRLSGGRQRAVARVSAHHVACRAVQ